MILNFKVTNVKCLGSMKEIVTVFYSSLSAVSYSMECVFKIPFQKLKIKIKCYCSLKRTLNCMPGGLFQKILSTNPHSTFTSKVFSKQRIFNIPSIKKNHNLYLHFYIQFASKAEIIQIE